VYGSSEFNKRYYYQGAIGYYKKLKNEHVLEVYGGVGAGYGSYSQHDSFLDTSGDYQVYFTQVNYGKLGNESSPWDFGFGLKTGLFHSNLFMDYDGNAPTDDYYKMVNDLILEPTVFTRVGDEHLKFGIKLGFLMIPKGLGSYFPFNAAFTVNYRL